MARVSLILEDVIGGPQDGSMIARLESETGGIPVVKVDGGVMAGPDATLAQQTAVTLLASLDEAFGATCRTFEYGEG